MGCYRSSLYNEVGIMVKDRQQPGCFGNHDHTGSSDQVKTSPCWPFYNAGNNDDQ